MVSRRDREEEDIIMSTRSLGILMLAALLAGATTSAQSGPKPAAPPSETGGKPPKAAAKATISLDQLVQLALANNPSIVAAAKAVEAREASIQPQGTLDDPVFSFQTMGDLVPPELQRGDPSSGRTFTIEQDIPFPGKLGFKEKIAAKEAEAASWDYEQTRRQIIADLKKAYYDYFLIHKSIGIVSEDKNLLGNFEQIAQAKYRVGQGSQQDVFKAQVEISKLIDRLTVLDQRRQVSTALINSLIYREPGAPLEEPAELVKAPLRYSLEELQQLALAHSPGINRQQREIERNEVAVKLARLGRYPDFAVGFSYVDRGDLPEMYGLTFKAKLPLYFGRKQGPELVSAQSELAGALKTRDNITSTLHYQVREAYSAATASDQLIQLYQQALLPQSGHSLEAAIASYQVGAADS